MATDTPKRTYTQGPWKWDPDASAVLEDRDALVDAAGDAIVCGVWHNDSTAGVWVHPDNAHLIAAAPDLYEALEAFVARYAAMVNSGDCGNWNPEEEDFVIAARSALAKASGGAGDPR